MNSIQASELFIFGFNGVSLSPEVEAFLKHSEVGGVILFSRNIESIQQVVSLNKSIIETNNKTPPIISVDQEGGRVARLRNICTELPPMANLTHAFIKDPKLAYRIGAMLGRELVALGFNLNFAPVCDVLVNSKSEVIGDRAFSDSSEIVALISSQIILGMQGAGIAACAKHFPGHGSTSLDSHLELPTIETDLATLGQRDLLPFKSAIKNQVASIMTAHIVANCLDKKLPATMSPLVLDNILRKKLGFNGLIISDDLDMKAVADNFSLPEILERSLLASVDMFIIGNDFMKTMYAVEILQKLIDQSPALQKLAKNAITRIRALKSRYIGKPLAPSLSIASSIVRSKPHLDLVDSFVLDNF